MVDLLNNEVVTLPKTIFKILSETLNAVLLTWETEADVDLKEIKRVLLFFWKICLILWQWSSLQTHLCNYSEKSTKSVRHQLQQLHATHIGAIKMKQLVRRFVYWKLIDKDIKNYFNLGKTESISNSIWFCGQNQKKTGNAFT